MRLSPRCTALLAAAALAACDDYAGDFGAGVSGSASIASISVIPPTPTIQVGNTVQLSAVVILTSGDTITGRTIDWTSDNTTVATVGATTGLVTGAAAGSTFVNATVAGDTVTGRTLVTVTN